MIPDRHGSEQSPDAIHDLVRIIDPSSRQLTHLVLSREKDESVVVHDPSSGEVIAVLSIIEIRSKGRIRIGCHAPKNMSVDRANVYLKKLAEQNATPPETREEIEVWLRQHSSRRR